MLTFHINFYCLKAYHRPDHSIRPTQNRNKKTVIPKSYTFIRTQTQGNFLQPPHRNNVVLDSTLLSCLVNELQKSSHQDSSPGPLASNVVKVSCLRLGAVPLEIAHTKIRNQETSEVSTCPKSLLRFKASACKVCYELV
jgi:hypothetical protein